MSPQKIEQGTPAVLLEPDDHTHSTVFQSFCLLPQLSKQPEQDEPFLTHAVFALFGNAMVQEHGGERKTVVPYLVKKE